MQKFIVYGSGSGKRKITVVDGMPYYQSTGENSGMSGVWLPFIMLVGNYVIKLPHALSVHCKLDNIKLLLQTEKTGYIIKYEEENLLQWRVEDNKKFNLPHRLPTRDTFITSMRLGSPSIPGVSLNEDEDEAEYGDEAILRNTVIEFKESAELETKDADRVNQWLIQNNAIFLSAASTAKKRVDPLIMVAYNKLREGVNVDLNYFKNKPTVWTIKTVTGIIKEIERVDLTTYGDDELKIRKIIALYELADEIIRADITAKKENKSIDFQLIINSWKGKPTAIKSDKTNYALISEHRRDGWAGLFNFRDTLSKKYIDTMCLEEIPSKTGELGS